jgi:hypothetical protein
VGTNYAYVSIKVKEGHKAEDLTQSFETLYEQITLLHDLDVAAEMETEYYEDDEDIFL